MTELWFPRVTRITPGNFGTVDIGRHNNSTADISRQILNGPNQADFDAMGGSVAIPPGGTLWLQGDTGISAGFKDELAAIRGQTRLIPIYNTTSDEHPTRQGNNTRYPIKMFVGVTILDVRLTGGNKQLTIQPEYCVEPTAVPGASGGSMSTQFVLRPLGLTR